MEEQAPFDNHLKTLVEGNERFYKGQYRKRDFSTQIRDTASKQQPFAAILSCIDSRVPVEIIFDQGIGDLFSIRVAGNVVNPDVIGSFEFACQLVKVPLLVVLGHSRCGAIAGACEGLQLGHLSGLLKRIQPALEKTEASGKDFNDRVAENNVQLALEKLRVESTVLSALEQQQKLFLVGAMYDVTTGHVRFTTQSKN